MQKKSYDLPKPETDQTTNSTPIEENQSANGSNIQTSTTLKPKDPQELVNLENKNQTNSTEKSSTQKLESPTLNSTTYATTIYTTKEATVQNVTSSK